MAIIKNVKIAKPTVSMQLFKPSLGLITSSGISVSYVISLENLYSKSSITFVKRSVISAKVPIPSTL
jgi:hypothetical protein